MGRKANRPHELNLRNRQGKAVCTYRGREYRFGKWDLKLDAPAPEAVAAFQRQVGLWTLNPEAASVADDSPSLLSLWNAWLESPQAPRVAPHILAMCNTHLFGTPAAPGPHLNTRVPSFTAADLLVWQTRLCDLHDEHGEPRYGRATVAKLVGLVRRCFDWGVTVGSVGADQFAGLERVKPPARGQVKEAAKRGTVGFEAVERVCDRLAWSDMAALVRCLWWTGARPGELCAIDVGMVRRGGVIRSRVKSEISLDLDAHGVWAANLGDKHKTAHLGKERVIFFGPHAQEVIRPLLSKASERPVYETATGTAYTGPRVYTYVRKAVKRAGVRPFTPYEIRHSFAVRVVEAFSSEIAGSGYMAAQSALGHSLRGVTSVYTGQDWITAAKVARRCG